VDPRITAIQVAAEYIGICATIDNGAAIGGERWLGIVPFHSDDIATVRAVSLDAPHASVVSVRPCRVNDPLPISRPGGIEFECIDGGQPTRGSVRKFLEIEVPKCAVDDGRAVGRRRDVGEHFHLEGGGEDIWKKPARAFDGVFY